MEYFKLIDVEQTSIRTPNTNYLKSMQPFGSTRYVETVS